MPMPGRHHLEGVERLHAPLQELVALAVALELQLHVQVERVGRAVVVDLHRVVDHQVDRHQRLDHLRIGPIFFADAAHRGEVGEQRHAGEVLQHDARDDERDLVGARAFGCQFASCADVLLGDLLAVAVAQHRLEHDPDRDRQAIRSTNSFTGVAASFFGSSTGRGSRSAAWREAAGEVGLELLDQHRHAFLAAALVADRVLDHDLLQLLAVGELDVSALAIERFFGSW
jgi:hypothetical protein